MADADRALPDDRPDRLDHLYADLQLDRVRGRSALPAGLRARVGRRLHRAAGVPLGSRLAAGVRVARSDLGSGLPVRARAGLRPAGATDQRPPARVVRDPLSRRLDADLPVDAGADARAVPVLAVPRRADLPGRQCRTTAARLATRDQRTTD